MMYAPVVCFAELVIGLVIGRKLFNHDVGSMLFGCMVGATGFAILID